MGIFFKTAKSRAQGCFQGFTQQNTKQNKTTGQTLPPQGRRLFIDVKRTLLREKPQQSPTHKPQTCCKGVRVRARACGDSRCCQHCLRNGMDHTHVGRISRDNTNTRTANTSTSSPRCVCPVQSGFKCNFQFQGLTCHYFPWSSAFLL